MPLFVFNEGSKHHNETFLFSNTFAGGLISRVLIHVIILVVKQIGLPLRDCLIFLITRMITDRMGLHSVLLPLLMECIFLFSNTCVEGPIIRRGAYKKQFTVIGKISIQCSNPYSNFIPYQRVGTIINYIQVSIPFRSVNHFFQISWFPVPVFSRYKTQYRPLVTSDRRFVPADQ